MRINDGISSYFSTLSAVNKTDINPPQFALQINDGLIVGQSLTCGVTGSTGSVGLNVNGQLVATGNVSGLDIIATSDVRTKNNIVTIDSALEKVLSLRGVFYERNTEPGERRVGVIAQEVEEILPEVVYTDVDGMKSVSYGSIIGLLIQAIKEQQEILSRH